MLSTGYLTLAERYIPYEETKLRLPNEEIRHLFIEEVDNWFADMAESADRTPLFSAIWNGKNEELSKILTAYLRKTISYYDYSESYYHAFTAGLVASSGYRVMSNRESGNGRPDLIIADADTGKLLYSNSNDLRKLMIWNMMHRRHLRRFRRWTTVAAFVSMTVSSAMALHSSRKLLWQ